MPISSVQSDYFTSLEGRDYDYGPAFAGHAQAQVVWEGVGMIGVRGRFVETLVQSGFKGDHFQAAGTAEARFYLMGRFGLGAEWTVYYRSSHYQEYPDVTQDGKQGRIYASIAVPRWRP